MCKKANSTTTFLRRNYSTILLSENQGYVLYINGQTPGGICLCSVGTLYPVQHQQIVKCTAPGCKICAGRLADHQQCFINDSTAGMGTTTTSTQTEKAVLMYKILHFLVPFHLHHSAILSATIRGHQHQIQVPYARTETFKGSFFPSGIFVWNTSPSCVTEAQSLDVQVMTDRHELTLSDSAPLFSPFLNFKYRTTCCACIPFKTEPDLHNQGC